MGLPKKSSSLHVASLADSLSVLQTWTIPDMAQGTGNGSLLNLNSRGAVRVKFSNLRSLGKSSSPSSTPVADVRAFLSSAEPLLERTNDLQLLDQRENEVDTLSFHELPAVTFEVCSGSIINIGQAEAQSHDHSRRLSYSQTRKARVSFSKRGIVRKASEEKVQASASEIAGTERPRKRRGGVFEQLLCGGFAGIVSRTAVAPIDLVRTHLISSHNIPGAPTTAAGVLKEVLRRDGWRGLFRGNGVNCLRVGPHKAIELCTFETLKRLLLASADPVHLQLAAPLSGGAAGMVGTLATYPLELIRTRITIQPLIYTDLSTSISKIVREEGFFSLYRGILPSLAGVFPYAASSYLVYDRLRACYRRTTGRATVPAVPTLLFGAVSAAAASAVTFPLEVARRQLQLGTVAASGASVCQLHGPRTAIQVLSHIWHTEGPAAIYRGLGTTWLKLVPAAGISFVCYEAARVALRVDDASYAAAAAAAAMEKNRQR